MTFPTDFDKFQNVFLVRVWVGVLLIILGLGYLFDPRIILRLNAFMREQVFKDAHVLLRNKHIGAFLLAIGFLLLVVSLR